MFGRPHHRCAAHQPKSPRGGSWRLLAALLLVIAAPGGGWRWDGAGAADSIALRSPAAGATIPAGEPARFVWSSLAGASAYRVVFGEGERTGPWVETAAWDAGSLPTGRYRWRVAARTAAGLVWSGEREFVVGDGAPESLLALPEPAAAPQLDLAVGGAIVGTRLIVTGTGFAPGETVDLTWERSGEAAPERATAGDDGDWTMPVLVPDIPGGGETLAARGDASGAAAQAPLAILPSLERSPAAGPPGAQIEVGLRGFAANEQVALHWNDGPPLVTALTHGDGAARIRVAIPQADPGVGALVAIGETSDARASAIFQIDAAPTADAADATPAAPDRPTIGADTTVGDGSFAVTAALTGTVGAATASDHPIVAGDRFASLPICVTTSCPWLDPGVNHPLWGVRVECGAACAVRVTDPTSGRCAVAPVLDVGPWFSDDDWWEPAPRRRINRLAGAVYSLATGYAAAAAARDGYDVGFGRSANGVGISDRGYDVGDGAALGLAAGSWADLGLPPDQTVAPITATLLWISGEDPATAAATCEAANAALPAPDPADPPPAPAATPVPATPAPAAADATVDPAPTMAPDPRARDDSGSPSSPVASAVVDPSPATPAATQTSNGDRAASAGKDQGGSDRADRATPPSQSAAGKSGDRNDNKGGRYNDRAKTNGATSTDPAG